MSIDVRKAKVGDEVRMAEILVAAWQHAYSGIMSPELLDALDINQKTDMWRTALERAGKGSYLVAEVNGRVEGFAVFGPARDKDLDGAESAEIVAINIDPDHWGSGLGCALLNTMIERLSTDGFGSIYLWVVEQNERALRFYHRNGFASEGGIKTDPKHTGVQELRLVRILA